MVLVVVFVVVVVVVFSNVCMMICISIGDVFRVHSSPLRIGW